MIEIHVPSKLFAKVKKVYKNSERINKDSVLLIESDKNIDVRMFFRNGEQLHEWFRGIDSALSFINRGYVRITKRCPYRHRKCIGENCALYVIQRDIGDCAIVWSAVK